MMVRTWMQDDPKAGLMARKRAQIVEAASAAFLEAGYAEASVNKIAAAAGVSIKTLYRHYENKDELFSAVMEAACGRDAEGRPLVPAWYDLTPDKALQEAGAEYLRHILSPEQLALYRVVVRDAHRFPDLGQRYLEATTAPRDALFAGYINLWADRREWTINNPAVAAQLYAGLLKAGLYETALCGGRVPHEDEIMHRSTAAAGAMLVLLDASML